MRSRQHKKSVVKSSVVDQSHEEEIFDEIETKDYLRWQDELDAEARAYGHTNHLDIGFSVTLPSHLNRYSRRR